MVNTLRIISFIAAVLAVAFFVFPVVYGVHSDERVKEFLKTPEIREKFENAADSRMNKNKDVISPLVKEAQAFASYLNPKSDGRRAQGVPSRSTVKPALRVTPKFKLRCTSYCEDDPNLSLALIDEPGKGRYWVKPSSKVGHLLIEQIQDGRIVIQGSNETFEIAIEESTVKSGSTISKRTNSPTRFQSGSTPSERRPSSISRPSTSGSKTEKQEPDEAERDARARALIEKLRTLQKSTVSDKTTGPDDKERAERIEKLISQYQSTRISPEEAKKLGNLGKTLKDGQSDPNRTPSDTGKSR